MSYHPKKGMHLKDPTKPGRNQMQLFDVQQTLSTSGKKWFRGTVLRKAVDGRGNAVKKDKQTAEVFCRESDVIGLLFKSCPTNMQGVEGTIETNVWYNPL